MSEDWNKYIMDQGYKGPDAGLEVLVNAINFRIGNKGSKGKVGKGACSACGEPEQIAKDCPDKDKGPMCYNFNEF